MLANLYSCQSQATNKSIGPAALNQQIKTSTNPVILDVRTAEEFKDGHLPNAINMDYYEDDFKTEMAKLSMGNTYVVYCETGGRSASAAKVMRKAGFQNVVELDGGFSAWVDAKLPTVKD